ncbi:uncharacterized protein LOC5518589 isoform X2 [Nematostella vectensis]|uniref:uncharacterized protein LOC5518589 isoform X2 n=1 Tax=Nematostella vectensis TaxID=45351 RepID=UPI0020779887|nr:uncharacterized protein LOC5518589 isoform X2 [Nematostella vectensis]
MSNGAEEKMAVPSSNFDNFLQAISSKMDWQSFKQETKKRFGDKYTLSSQSDMYPVLKKLENHGQIDGSDFTLLDCYAEKSANREELKNELAEYKAKSYHPKSQQIVGREKDLDGLNKLLGNRFIKAVNLFGASGVGKTTLAQVVAKGFCQTNGFRHLCVDLRDITDISNVHFQLLQAFGLTCWDKDIQRLYSHLNASKDNESRKSTFLLLDNVEQLLTKARSDFIAMLSSLMASSISSSGEFKILITSREEVKELSLKMKGFSEKMVEKWDVGFSKRFIVGQSKMSEAKANEENDVLGEIAKLCENNTYLLQGFAQIIREGTEPQEILQQIKMQLANADVPEQFACINKVFESLPNSNVKNFAIKISLFRRSFTGSMAQRLTDSPTLIDACFDLEILARHKILNVVDPEDKSGERAYDIHSIFHEFVDNYLCHKPEFASIYKAGQETFFRLFTQKLEKLSKLLETEFVEAYNQLEGDRPNFEFSLEIASQKDDKWFLLYSDEYYTSAYLSTLFECLKDVKQRKKLYEGWSKTAESEGHWLSGAQMRCWESLQEADLFGPEEAMKVLDKAKKNLQKAHNSTPYKNYMAIEGLYHHCIGRTKWLLAEKTQGKQKEGIAGESLLELEYSLEIRRKQLGEHTQTSRTLNLMGNALMALNKPEEALKRYQEAMNMKTRLIGSEEHCEMPTFYNQMAAVHERLSEKTQEGKEHHLTIAKEWMEKAIKLQKELGVGETEHTATFQRNLANVLLALKEYDLALEVAQESYRLRKERLGTHPETARILYMIGVIHEWRKDPKSASEAYEKAFVVEEALPSNNHSVVRSMIRERLLKTCEKISDTDRLNKYQQKIRDIDNEVIEDEPHSGPALSERAPEPIGSIYVAPRPEEMLSSLKRLPRPTVIEDEISKSSPSIPLPPPRAERLPILPRPTVIEDEPHSGPALSERAPELIRLRINSPDESYDIYYLPEFMKDEVHSGPALSERAPEPKLQQRTRSRYSLVMIDDTRSQRALEPKSWRYTPSRSGANFPAKEAIKHGSVQSLQTDFQMEIAGPKIQKTQFVQEIDLHRVECKIMDDKGATWELESFGIFLNIPPGALKQSVEIQCVRHSPTVFPSVDGEVFVSHIVEVGPKPLTSFFTPMRPILLHIRHSGGNALGYETVAKVINGKTWEDIDSSIVHDEDQGSYSREVKVVKPMTVAIVKRLKFTRFEVSVEGGTFSSSSGKVHKTSLSGPRPKVILSSWPRADVTFPEGAITHPCQGKMAVLPIPSSAPQKAGWSPYPILIMEGFRGLHFQKPVTVTFPFEHPSSETSSIRLLCGENGEWRDVTDEVKITESHMLEFEVRHFSRLISARDSEIKLRHKLLAKRHDPGQDVHIRHWYLILWPWVVLGTLASVGSLVAHASQLASYVRRVPVAAYIAAFQMSEPDMDKFDMALLSCSAHEYQEHRVRLEGDGYHFLGFDSPDLRAQDEIYPELVGGLTEVPSSEMYPTKLAFLGEPGKASVKRIEVQQSPDCKNTKILGYNEPRLTVLSSTRRIVSDIKVSGLRPLDCGADCLGIMIDDKNDMELLKDVIEKHKGKIIKLLSRGVQASPRDDMICTVEECLTNWQSGGGRKLFQLFLLFSRYNEHWLRYYDFHQGLIHWLREDGSHEARNTRKRYIADLLMEGKRILGLPLNSFARIEDIANILTSTHRSEAWKSVARRLPVAETLIESCVHDHRDTIEQCTQVLLAWTREVGSWATLDRVFNALTLCHDMQASYRNSSVFLHSYRELARLVTREAKTRVVEHH